MHSLRSKLTTRLPSYVLAMLISIVLVACTSSNQPGALDGDRLGQAAGNQPSRQLVIAVRNEPPSLAIRALGQPGGTLTVAKGLFSARIAVLDSQGKPIPQLVETLPLLGTDSWRVFPDGRMETTYRLKSNLSWHDGTPLTSDAFVFSWRVYSVPANGLAASAPFEAMAEVVARDPQTFVVNWTQPYPAAARLSASRTEFPPLPPHILEPPLAQLSPEAFVNHPYWTRDYVGLGPYLLGQWEPGAYLEGSAFDGYVFGRPRVDHVKLVFVSDPNATLARVLAGEVHMVGDNAIAIEQADVLKREWGRGGGTILLSAGGSWRATFFQLRPEFANPATALDPRVRKSLAYALDKQTINDVVFSGGNLDADSMITPRSELGAAADRGVVKYPYDLRLSEVLMNQAGFIKGADGFFTSRELARFTGSLVAAGSDFSAELTAMASGWRKAGFSLEESLIPVSQAADAQAAATFPFMANRSTASDLPALVGLTSPAIPRPENRWTGPNRGGWSNPEYDRLLATFSRTLEPDERASQVAGLVRIWSEDLPMISLSFPALPYAFVSALTGPELADDLLWNVYLWELH